MAGIVVLCVVVAACTVAPALRGEISWVERAAWAVPPVAALLFTWSQGMGFHPLVFTFVPSLIARFVIEDRMRRRGLASE
ncbi:hypothetical protein [Cellulomonas alba]|uniref:Uncharacterized protein n=1 Tax=Cellulomonas alba TaxID=3053467 RepID=A0ABT7SBY7_9CELL|nr:hypothetical protein [Cellulomonas alba]MDM7853701.1 hypothetical protein [Cellulomonas alba]